MDSSVTSLLPLFERERGAGRDMALGIVVGTKGSTYRKRGALILFTAGDDCAGLLSGGCLEGDLREHSRPIFREGKARIVRYSLREPDDVLWGLAVGCEGEMRILLIRVGCENNWQPLAHLVSCHHAHRGTTVGIVLEDDRRFGPTGTILLPEETLVAEHAPHSKIFRLSLALPPRVVLLGGGPDAVPVADFAAQLGWKVAVVDHRPAFADPSRFPNAEGVTLSRAEEFHSALRFSHYDAAVVMSHHLPSDLAYLQALSASRIPYIGLLGPPARRERLLADLGVKRHALHGRLRAPVGLALGGRGPESIALAIVAEIHAFLHGKADWVFSKAPSAESPNLPWTAQITSVPVSR